MLLLLVGCISLHVDAISLNGQGNAIKAGLELTVPDLQQVIEDEPVREVGNSSGGMTYQTLKGWGIETLLLSNDGDSQLAFGLERTWAGVLRPDYGSQRLWKTAAVGAQALSFYFEPSGTSLNLLQPYGSLGILYVVNPEHAVEVGIFGQSGRGLVRGSQSMQFGGFVSYRFGFQPYTISLNPVAL